MEIETKSLKAGELYVKPIGRIDTMTAVTFGNAVYDKLDDIGNIEHLILDFSNVEYISSMGLRILLELQKRMKTQGDMVLMNVNSDIAKVFEITGFDEVLTIIE